uniref:Protein kinase domain-containing protein n=1 Tax=Meloidogyne floridensis TaxID=298350 RepID=A0A915NH49_9BILA
MIFIGKSTTERTVYCVILKVFDSQKKNEYKNELKVLKKIKSEIQKNNVRNSKLIELYNYGEWKVSSNESEGKGTNYVLVLEYGGKPFDSYWKDLVKDDKNEQKLVPQAMNVVKQTAEIFKELHSYNVLHLDLKPQNLVYIEGNGGKINLKLVDFGISKILEENEIKKKCPFFKWNKNECRSNLKVEGKGSSGTPQFMSYEQYTTYKDEKVYLSQKSDIWSFGVLTFYLISQAVYKGTSYSYPFMTEIVEGTPIDLQLENMRTAINLKHRYKLMKGQRNLGNSADVKICKQFDNLVDVIII